MDVSVGHFQSQHHLCHLLTGEGTSDGQRHALGKELERGQFVVVHIKDVIYLAARNHQRVTLHQRINVKECVELLVLCALVARNLTCSNLTENIHYAKLILSIRNLMVPRGICTSTSSPTFLPSSP